MGGVPLWYRVVQAARYLGVPPWELEHQSLEWLLMAEEARGIEAYAQEIAEDKAKRKQGKGTH